ncbi:hypothetical protein [Aurantivibrio plasticivorans]
MPKPLLTKSNHSENVKPFPQVPNTPFALDKTLYHAIAVYLETGTWRQLSSEIKDFVRSQYVDAFELVTKGDITPKQLEDEIASHIPSRSYIEQYSKGRAVCYRYLNTLANFFEHKYTLSNHNPCDQFLEKITSAKEKH